MILKELGLENFRAFPSERIKFSERVTVIAGINGRGKSSILDALSLLLSRLLPQVTPARGGYKYLQAGDIHLGTTELQLKLFASFKDIPVEYPIRYSAEQGQKAGKILPQVRQAIKKVYGDPQREGDAAPIAVYYTTDRAAYRLPKKLLTSLRQDQSAAYHGALFNRQIDFRDFMSRLAAWTRALERNEDPYNLNKRTIEAINRAIGIFLPDFGNIQICHQPLKLIATKRGQEIDLVQMSDGERSLFAMVIDLCRRLALANPDLSNPLDGSGVVLIDEVELHLHPTWQREIVEKLRTTFTQVQFVLTTHSPFVVQTLRAGELLLLGNGEDERGFLDPGEYTNRGLEEVTTKVMGITDPNVVPRYIRLLDTAREYYRLLETAQPDDEQQLEHLKCQLDSLVEPFPDEPEYRAFLEVQRVAAFKEGSPIEDERA